MTDRHEPWTAEYKMAPEATRNDAFGGFVNRRLGVRISPSAPVPGVGDDGSRRRQTGERRVSRPRVSPDSEPLSGTEA